MDTGSRKAQLRKWRDTFRESVFARDKFKCVACNELAVDAHHITDRTEMPNGGYVMENGISLCAACHLLAEEFHATKGETFPPGFHPNDLYRRICSSKEKAVDASTKLDSRL